MFGVWRHIVAPLAALAVLFAPRGGSLAQSYSELRALTVNEAVSRVQDSIVQLQLIGGGDPLSSAGSASSPVTGVLISPEGLIATSSYRMDPRPASVVVTYHNGDRSTGKVLAIDHNRQLALIQARQGPEDSPVPLAQNDAPRVGETAIAVGRTYRADEPNVAVGIVSAVKRLYGRAVQTDAAVSPANYGGPLIDLRGRVIGILTPLAPSSEGNQAGVGWYDSGIGFAVPVAHISARLPRLLKGDDIRRGLAGIAFEAGNPFSSEPKLLAVHPGGPADQAGLKKEDLLRRVNGQRINSPNDYRQMVEAMDDLEVLRVTASRGDEAVTAEIVLTAELKPYRRAYLGFIAQRESQADERPGVAISGVLTGTPAAEAGAESGDRLLEIDGLGVANRTEAIHRLAGSRPGDEIVLTLKREANSFKLKLTAAALDFTPDAAAPLLGEADEEELVVTGSTRKCRLLKPKGAHEGSPVLIWLGGDKTSAAAPNLNAIAGRGCLVVAPAESEEPPTRESERAFLSALLDALKGRPDVDSQRIAIGGTGRPAAHAVAVGFLLRERLAGIVVGRWSGRLPRVSPNDPSYRLGLLLLSSAPRDRSLAERFTEQGYPVSLSKANSDMMADDRLAAWLVGLDRF